MPKVMSRIKSVKPQWIGLIGGLMVALGPKIAEVATWSATLTPLWMGEVVTVIGGVLVAWYFGKQKST